MCKSDHSHVRLTSWNQSLDKHNQNRINFTGFSRLYFWNVLDSNFFYF